MTSNVSHLLSRMSGADRRLARCILDANSAGREEDSTCKKPSQDKCAVISQNFSELKFLQRAIAECLAEFKFRWESTSNRGRPSQSYIRRVS